MKSIQVYTTAAFAFVAAAFPSVKEQRQAPGDHHLPHPHKLDKHEGNSGVIPVIVFDAKDQFVDVRPGTDHAFVAPKKGDLRGPCPGLNAAANHNFISHDGVVTTLNVCLGIEKAYNIGPEFCAILSVIAIALAGDPILETWSIGGCNPASIDLLTNPGGLSYSHNKYESDSSPGRGDAYLHGGDAHSLQLDNFNKLYDMGEFYTLDMLRTHNKRNHDFSVSENPFFFAAPFGSLVPPAAYNFIPNFMSNRSEEHKDGILNRDVLKTFFAVSGPRSKHVWNRGMEQIPQNWYRRPTTNQYNFAPENVADLGLTFAMYPGIFDFGGNMGKKNSFVGVDVADLTGGLFTSKNLLEGNNLGCLMLQSVQAVLPDYLDGVVKDVEPVLKLVSKVLTPVTKKMKCPALTQYNQYLFNKFPGYKYNPKNPKGCATSW